MNFYSISSDGRIVHWTIVKVICLVLGNFSEFFFLTSSTNYQFGKTIIVSIVPAMYV